MQDEITLPDLGNAMIVALNDADIPQERHSFDLIVHSTGGLVGREYLRQVCYSEEGHLDASLTPVRHFVFLAPANFGSPLAHVGKSMFGRLFKGWKWDGFMETGTGVLNALELASPYSAQLAMTDLFDPGFPIFDPCNTLATVMVGTVGYDDRFKRILHENGSDGTVRVSTANLNAKYVKAYFRDPELTPDMKVVSANCPEIPFAVFKRNHGNITEPTAIDDQVGELLLKALRVTKSGYPEHREYCRELTAETYAAGLKSRSNSDKEKFHQYMNVVFYVHDQFGNPVDDYFIELYQEDDDEDTVFEKINREILEDVHVNRSSGAWRSLYFDMDDMKDLIETHAGEVSLSLVAARVSELIGYANPPDVPETGGVPVLSQKNKSFFFPNQTLLVEIEINRTQSAEVFRLKPKSEV